MVLPELGAFGLSARVRSSTRIAGICWHHLHAAACALDYGPRTAQPKEPPGRTKATCSRQADPLGPAACLPGWLSPVERPVRCLMPSQCSFASFRQRLGTRHLALVPSPSPPCASRSDGRTGPWVCRPRPPVLPPPPSPPPAVRPCCFARAWCLASSAGTWSPYLSTGPRR